MRVHLHFPPVNRGRRGLTILEVMLAAFILSVVSLFFFQMLVAGDKVRGRGRLLQTVATLAANEAEHIKSAIGSGGTLDDSLYSIEVDKRLFIVERTVIERDDDNLPAYLANTQELEISVHPAELDTALVRFRVIQGYLP
jgi:hypothetical protein